VLVLSLVLQADMLNKGGRTLLGLQQGLPLCGVCS